MPFLLPIVLCIGLTVSFIPQHIKIIYTSTAGISPLFLFLGSLGCLCSFLNVLILQFDYINCHQSLTCFETILGIAPVGLQWFMFSLVIILYFIFYSEPKQIDGSVTRHYTTAKVMIKSVAFIHLFLFPIAIALTFFRGSSSPLSITIASILGIIALIIACIQYIPQITTTYRFKSAGGLSIPMMLLQTPGGFLFAVSIASLPTSHWTSWISYLIAGSLQGILLGLCITYHFQQMNSENSLFDQLPLDV